MLECFFRGFQLRKEKSKSIEGSRQCSCFLCDPSSFALPLFDCTGTLTGLLERRLRSFLVAWPTIVVLLSAFSSKTSSDSKNHSKLAKDCNFSDLSCWFDVGLSC